MKKDQKKHSPRLYRNLTLLAWNAFFAELRIYYPVAVLAFQAVSGSFVEAMGVFALMGVSQAFLEVPTGIFSDKIGRRNTLISGSLAEVIGAGFLALAFLLPHGVWALYVGAAFIGLANALHSGNSDALIYETLSHYKQTQKASKVFGRIGSMGQGALALSGGLAALCLWLGMSYTNLMVLSVFPVLASFVFTLFIVEPTKREVEETHTIKHMKKALHLIVSNPRLRWLTIASAIKTGLGQASHSFTPGFIETVWPLWLTPLYRTAQNGIGAISFWFSGRLTERYGLMKTLLGGSAYSYLAALIAYLMSTVISPVLLLSTQISYASSITAEKALKQESFSNAQRSTMESIISLAGALVGGAGSIIAGYLADIYSPSQSLIVLLSITLPTVIVYYKLYQKERIS